MDYFEITLVVFMTVLSIFDIGTRKLPVILLKAGAVLAVFRLAYILSMNGPPSEQQRILTVALLGALPGAAMTAVSFITDKVGRGDGVVLIILGLFENCSFVTLVSCMACQGLAVFSGILLVLHRVGRNTRIPFVPFLTGAYLVMFISMRRYGY